jgi:hypothetical protein
MTRNAWLTTWAIIVTLSFVYSLVNTDANTSEFLFRLIDTNEDWTLDREEIRQIRILIIHLESFSIIESSHANIWMLYAIHWTD